MNDIITKELLSSVFGFDVVYTEKCDHRNNIIGIWNDINKHPIIEINIYELAHKCKEWGNSKGYSAITWYPDFEECQGTIAICRLYEPFKEFSECSFSCIADTEPEAIFKACQWILDNKEAN